MGLCTYAALTALHFQKHNTTQYIICCLLLLKYLLSETDEECIEPPTETTPITRPTEKGGKQRGKRSK